MPQPYDPSVARTLFPVVQLRLGVNRGYFGSSKEPYKGQAQRILEAPSFILTIPPEHLVEFTNISRQGGADHMTISFIDATFGELERKIFDCDKNYGGRLLYRWGYPDAGLEKTDWRICILDDYTPSISSSGLRITLNCRAIGSQYASYAEPTVYYGKISSVVSQIAKEMGFSGDSVFVEETDDDSREEIPKSEWATGAMTRIDLIQSRLLLEARSKVNPNGVYEFALTTQGTFHFHTQYFKKIKRATVGSETPSKEPADSKTKYRKFNVLFGIPNGVLNFSPRYTPRSMGQFAATAIAAVYDPRLKQFNQKLIDRRTLGMTSAEDPKSGGRTTAAPFANKDDQPIDQRKKSESYAYVPVRQVALGGHCSGKAVHQHHGPEAAIKVVENAWKHLHGLVQGGLLELVGLPEHSDFIAMETYCDIVVYLPVGLKPIAGQPVFNTIDAALHWSSGRYLIKTVTHSITADYKIIVELGKLTMLEGPDSAKTGLREADSTATTGVAR